MDVSDAFALVAEPVEPDLQAFVYKKWTSVRKGNEARSLKLDACATVARTGA